MTMPFFQRWMVTTVAVLIATFLVDGIASANLFGLLLASLTLGLLNAFLRPLLLLLTLPLVILSFGISILILNALLLYFVGWMARGVGFTVDSFWSAFWGALIISLVSLISNSFLGTSETRWEVRRRQPPRSDKKDSGGPVIDV